MCAPTPSSKVWTLRQTTSTRHSHIATRLHLKYLRANRPLHNFNSWNVCRGQGSFTQYTVHTWPLFVLDLRQLLSVCNVSWRSIIVSSNNGAVKGTLYPVHARTQPSSRQRSSACPLYRHKLARKINLPWTVQLL